MSNSYREAFYRHYVSTHTAARKGSLTGQDLLSRQKVYTKRFGPHIPQNNKVRIADLGCGNGSVVWWLNKIGYHSVEGVDVSEEQIEEGRALGIGNLVCSDLLTYLNDRSEYFDVLILRNIIEHFNKDEIVTLLAKCHTALKPNGMIIVQVPNAESPFFGRIRYGDFTHEIAFTNSSMHQLLLVTGFKQPKCFACGPVATTFKSTLRAMVWQLIELIYGFIIFCETGAKKPIVSLDLIGIGCKS